jgi:glycosyltransferase involved in cell wall biosynthesis
VKITLFFTYGISLNDWDSSGILTRELEIYKKIYKENKIEFNLITYGGDKDSELQDFEGIEVFPVYSRLKYSKNKYISIFKSFLIPFVFKDVIKGSNILKTNQLKGSWVAIISKILYKKPLIIRTGYDLLRWSNYQNKTILNRISVRFLTKISLVFSNQYNVSTLSDKLFLEKQFGIKDKVKLRPNFVDLKHFVNRNEEKLEEILFVGRLEHQKNLDFLINEYKKYDLPKLNIIGNGTYLDKLQNEINKNSLNINYIDPIPNAELPHYYNKYRYFILCSHYEGNPKTLIEAMACGSIVIGNDVDGINNIIVDNFNGFLIKCNEGDLKGTIDKISTEKNKLKSIQMNAINFVLENHSLESLTKTELSDYDKLLDLKI